MGADSLGNVSKTCADSPDGKAFLYECHSYRDGIIKQSIERPVGEAIFYDELPLRVRTIDFSKPTGEFDIQLAATTISPRSCAAAAGWPPAGEGTPSWRQSRGPGRTCWRS